MGREVATNHCFAPRDVVKGLKLAPKICCQAVLSGRTVAAERDGKAEVAHDRDICQEPEKKKEKKYKQDPGPTQRGGQLI